MDTVLTTFTRLMRRKLWFVAALCALFVGGLIYGDGWTGTNIAIAMALLLMVCLFAFLVWFWTAVFTSMKSKQ